MKTIDTVSEPHNSTGSVPCKLARLAREAPLVFTHGLYTHKYLCNEYFGISMEQFEALNIII